MNRGFKYSARPDKAQEDLLASAVGVCRLVYNLAFEQRSNPSMAAQVRRVTGQNPNYHTQAAELTELRREFEFVRAVSQTCQQQALRDLDRAYRNFFEGRAAYPRPRRKFENDTARFQGRECAVRRLNRNWGAVKIPKVGEVRFRWTRDLPGFGLVTGSVKNVTVSRCAGEWFVSFSVELDAEKQVHDGGFVGIDRGVAAPLALSTGKVLHMPGSLKALDRKHRRAQQQAARGKRGSTRHAKALRRAARVKSKIARVRRHWQHEVTTDISRRYSLICLEDLKIRNMTGSARGTLDAPGRNVRQKAGLNRSILDVGWFEIARQLTYKSDARGGEVRLVDPRNTSRRCAACDYVSPDNRESQAVFRCGNCGHVDNADVNAARNILKAGTRPAWRDPVADPAKRESRRAA